MYPAGNLSRPMCIFLLRILADGWLTTSSKAALLMEGDFAV